MQTITVNYELGAQPSNVQSLIGAYFRFLTSPSDLYSKGISIHFCIVRASALTFTSREMQAYFPYATAGAVLKLRAVMCNPAGRCDLGRQLPRHRPECRYCDIEHKATQPHIFYLVQAADGSWIAHCHCTLAAAAAELSTEDEIWAPDCMGKVRFMTETGAPCRVAWYAPVCAAEPPAVLHTEARELSKAATATTSTACGQGKSSRGEVAAILPLADKPLQAARSSGIEAAASAPTEMLGGRQLEAAFEATISACTTHGIIKSN